MRFRHIARLSTELHFPRHFAVFELHRLASSGRRDPALPLSEWRSMP